MPDPDRRLAAIMFTDLVGYSALAQRDEKAALALLDRHNRLLRPRFDAFRGREVKTIGDAFLVEFDSALAATECALDLQRVLHDHNRGESGEGRIRVRIGVHVGDVVRVGNDVLGDAVNIASRIVALAEPEGICLTQQVYDQVQNKVAAPMVRLPPAALKNIRVPVTVYHLLPPWEAPPAGLRLGRPDGRHLAVLPLANISPDPGDEYFADGLTEELISVLSRVRDLNVIARTSVIPYKLAPKPIAQVGAELGVDTVLEGSVRKAGNRIRITLQLIDVATQGHIWANTYNRELNDVFEVQSDVAERTAEALRLELARRAPGAGDRRPTASVEAYDAYLRALVDAAKPGFASLEAAFRGFERATELDPSFAAAYGSWADVYVRAAGDTLPMRDVIPRARVLAQRAVELDPYCAEGHAALGNIAFQFDQAWDVAEREFRRALEINPSEAPAHRFYGLMLIALDRLDEAREEVRRQMRLDPEGSDGLTLALIELLDGQFDRAIDLCRYEGRSASEVSAPHVDLGLFLAGAGRWDDARAEADQPLGAVSEVVRYDHALLNALVGRPDEARALIAETERGESKSYTSATHLAILYAALGDRARALDLLERDYREGDRTLWLYYRGVWFDGLRDDPRFGALLARYGVPTDRVRGPPRPP
ncbi:MAG TPA: adenylate/guanylate cyclase domain-containing protein [Thermoplasmata archaeon]|nr:adenylate/guanylate cyclase domain-containing protein [Thermoplasmata archaeon]